MDQKLVAPVSVGDRYTVSCTPLVDVAELQRQWLDLEARAANTFFLSWSWMSTWLAAYEPEVDVLRIHRDRQIIGLALLVKTRVARRRILCSTGLFLHQLGDISKDQIWIEYNGFLTDARYHRAATASGLNYLMSEYAGWDELILGGLCDSEADYFSESTGLTRIELWQAPTYGVDLAKLRDTGQDYLSSLSRNTRYQIRRSTKGYHRQGPVKLEKAQCLGHALGWFEEMAPLHIKRWGSAPGASGFTNVHFTGFHRSLIQMAWPQRQIDIWKLTVGSRTIGFFYNFLYRGRVYFYLGGLVKESDSKLKPGLLGHSLCIEQYTDQGLQYYDFMGGHERYKESLGEIGPYLHKISLQKPQLKFRLEQWGRSIKNGLMNKRASQI